MWPCTLHCHVHDHVHGRVRAMFAAMFMECVHGRVQPSTQSCSRYKPCPWPCTDRVCVFGCLDGYTVLYTARLCTGCIHVYTTMYTGRVHGSLGHKYGCAHRPCTQPVPPFPQIDIIGAVVIVWRVRGKTIRSVLCNIVCNNCA